MSTWIHSIELNDDDKLIVNFDAQHVSCEVMKELSAQLGGFLVNEDKRCAVICGQIRLVIVRRRKPMTKRVAKVKSKDVRKGDGV